MEASIFKYSLLGPFERKEVEDFIDFLFNRMKKKDLQMLTEYKQRILSVSTWSEEEIRVIEHSVKQFNQWQPPTW